MPPAYIPSISGRIASRPRLLARLDAFPIPPIILVSAPAGYGKTTLVRQWADSRAGPTAWLTLTHGHRASGRFLQSVLASIGAQDHESASLESVLKEVTQWARRRPGSALVLDDYHVVEESDAQAVMTEIIAALPDHLHLVLVSRTPIRISLARRKLQGSVLQVTAGQLAFTEDEVTKVVRQTPSVELDDPAIRVLTERTQGWIAAIRLTLTSLASRDHTEPPNVLDELAGNPWLDRYVAEEVLDPLTPELRDFVLTTAFLPFLSPNLCDHALKSETSTECLTNRQRQGLFVERHSDRPDRLVYHPLFAATVRRIATHTLAPGHRDAILRRSADWLDVHHEPELALDQALSAGDIPTAERLVRHIGLPLAREDRAVKLNHWLESLPVSSLKANADFAYWYMFSAFHRGRAQDMMSLFPDVIPAWESTQDPVLHGYASLQKGLLYTLNGDPEHALTQLYAALEDLPPSRYLERLHAWAQIFVHEGARGNDESANRAYQEADACRTFLPAHQVTWWMVIQPYRAYISLLRGNPRLALESYDYADQTLPPTFQGHHGMFAYLKAAALLEMNDIEKAHELIFRSFEDFAIYPPDNWHPDALLLGAQIARIRGDLDTARAHLAEALVKAEHQGIRNQVVRINALEASWNIEDGDLLAAQAWAIHSDASGHLWRQEFGDLNSYIPLFQLRIAENRFSDALALADRLIREAADTRRWAETVQIAMWATVAHLGRDDETGALQSLRIALQHGRPGGLLRSFATPGHDLRPFLQRSRDQLGHKDALYVSELLKHRLWETAPPIDTSRIPDEQISSREMDVLRLVADGHMNRVIGEHLFITERTVKKHMSSILAKLNVSSRTEAVKRANDLGILERD